jgi:hypothetical protein
MSPKIIEHMTRHQSHDVIEGVMVHSSVGEVWKHFNSVHSQFLVETRNMHLGLCTNGFNPFWSFAAHYSYWVVILTIYNLLSKICIRPKFMFFSMVLLGPNSPDQNINVCLRPLIDKLIQLWSSRALTYNIYIKEIKFSDVDNFNVDYQ